MTARSLGKFFFTDGDTLERCYKDSLSGFREWNQLEHASDWVLLPENIGEHLKVKEVTMDLSESMADIVMQAFPNATIVLDCFHIMRRCNDAIEEMRLRCKREAQAKVRKEKSEFKKRQKRNGPIAGGIARRIPRSTRARPGAASRPVKTRSSGPRCSARATRWWNCSPGVDAHLHKRPTSGVNGRRSGWTCSSACIPR